MPGHSAPFAFTLGKSFAFAQGKRDDGFVVVIGFRD
jgi:hypothetical protein